MSLVLSQVVRNAKQRLIEQRDALATRHHAGESGLSICREWTDRIDEVVCELFDASLGRYAHAAGKSLDDTVALVALGGYARGEMAPYSDVDLLLLHHPSAQVGVGELVKGLVADASDLGLQLGFAVRTPAQALKLAWKDIPIFTAEVDARFLRGSVDLFREFSHQFRNGAVPRAGAQISRMEKLRTAERHDFGDTVYLLEPNVKRSLGCLRDVHFLRWAAFVRYQTDKIDGLVELGLLNHQDAEALTQGLEFLLRLRNELHYFARRTQDILRRPEQARIAEKWGYQGQAGLIPVEVFMREYFSRTSAIRLVVHNFISMTRTPTFMDHWITPLRTRRLKEHFLAGPQQIGITPKGLRKVFGNLDEILRLMELATTSNKRVCQETWYAIRDDLVRRGDIELTPEAATRFLSLLGQTHRLGSVLRLLHEVRALEKLVAGLDHARHLVQFNDYHKYTVDEHCIVAVERATQFISEPGPLGDAYRAVKDRPILHLALLIHDLGKGFTEDHSVVGARLALETAERLQLRETDTELLHFLVAKHLLMAHTTFRRDIADPATIAKFAAEVGSEEHLRALYLLTAADIAAVGPDTLTDWKKGFLATLYLRTQAYLTGTHDQAAQQADEKRQTVLKLVGGEDPKWHEIQVRSLPDAYVLETSSEDIAYDLVQLRSLIRSPVHAWGRYSTDRRVSTYCIGFRAGRARGNFHKIAGAFSGKGMNILAASVYTLANQAVLARIFAVDPDYPQAPPSERFREVEGTVLEAIHSTSTEPPAFRKRWQDAWKERRKNLTLLPTSVVLDQSSHPDVTIIDIFAHDRVGLLYTISRSIFEMGLIVHFAKISTHLDQVVSVFYVTDKDRKKVSDPDQCEEIRANLVRRIENE